MFYDDFSLNSSLYAQDPAVSGLEDTAKQIRRQEQGGQDL